MVYLFTQIPLVTASKPFVTGSGVFKLQSGGSKEPPQDNSFTFEVNVACGALSKTAPLQKRSLITLHIFNVGDSTRYPDDTVLFASGLLVFGAQVQGVSFQADASDVRVLMGKEQEDAALGTVFCSYVGTVQKYLQKPAGGDGLVSGLVHIDLPLVNENIDRFATYALIKEVPVEKAAQLKTNLKEGMIVEVIGSLAQIGFAQDFCAPVFRIKTIRSLPSTSPNVSKGEKPAESARKSEPQDENKNPDQHSGSGRIPPTSHEISGSDVVRRTYRAVQTPIYHGGATRKENGGADVVMTDGQPSTSGGN